MSTNQNSVLERDASVVGEAEISLSPAARERLAAELVELQRQRDLLAATVNDSVEANGDVADRAAELARFDEYERVERRIEDVLAALDRPVLVEAPVDVVGVGSTVTLRYADGSTEDVLVGDLLEDDGERLLVTPGSPLGRAVLGRAPGDEVVYIAPSGEVKVSIAAVGAA